ncbi:MAG: cupredoxin domain-containing protein [Solirubrobacteraceae bacterium]
MSRAARLLPVLLAAAVWSAGCGDQTPIPVENRTIGLRLDEYRVLPQAVSAPAGQLRMIIRNLGLHPHNIAVETIPEIGSDEPAGELARTSTVHAGQRSEVTFFIKPGTYNLVCTIANHDDLGQVGTLVVE